MNHLKIPPLAALLFCCTCAIPSLALRSAMDSQVSLRGYRPSEESTDGGLLCRILLNRLTTVDGDVVETHECSPIDPQTGKESSRSYELDIPREIAEANRRDIETNQLFVSVPGGYIQNHNVVVPDHSHVVVTSPPNTFQERLLQEENYNNERMTGNRTVLVVRITALDSEVDYTAEEIADYFFDWETPTLRSQYAACSFGQLIMNPATDYSQAGVKEVLVNMTAQDANKMDLVYDAIGQMESEFGASVGSLFDHVVFVLPPGTDGPWSGSGTTGHWRVLLNNERAATLSAQMHEIGHNIGFSHAGVNNRGAYQDYSDNMGTSSRAIHAPQKCFNGLHFWTTGWFSDSALEVDPAGGPQLVTIAAFPDYEKVRSNEYVLARIGDLFLVYNRRKGFNRGSSSGDALTVVTGNPSGGVTRRVSVLDEGFPLYHEAEVEDLEDFGLDQYGPELNIEICRVDTVEEEDSDIPDTMLVSIGMGPSLCGMLGGATQGPTTASLTTAFPTTASLITASPTTASPTTAAPTTASPTTIAPATTASPTTAAPITASPTTASPTTIAPTTASPTTVAPITASPTTASPTTVDPTTAAPTTAPPSTASPSTISPTTASPTTAAPTTASPTTASPTTAAPTTASPSTASPTTAAPTTASPTTASPTTTAPTTVSPTTAAPTTASPTTASPTDSVPVCEDSSSGQFSFRTPKGVLRTKRCSWLNSPSKVARYCFDGSDAMTVCPATCGVCG